MSKARVTIEAERTKIEKAPDRWFIVARVGGSMIPIGLGLSGGYATQADADDLIKSMRGTWMMTLMERQHQIRVVVGSDHETLQLKYAKLADLADWNAE